ncbi:structural maintenance of chromosomes protein 4-like [Schistocerca americana]|uniref:structural maintenance of chromosomes protein 4-like n=1 Tax=Schistocerca americana TaxID=7009 RepID=UPI001F4FE003|nr:structural maintenance of chromosomes protein 4-like [Schistocerca americana]
MIPLLLTSHGLSVTVDIKSVKHQTAKIVSIYILRKRKDNQELIDKEEQEKSELQRLLGEKLSQAEIIQKEKKKLLENIDELNQERDQQVMKKDKLNQKSGSYNNEGAGLKAEAEAAAEKQARMNELLQDEKKQLSDYEELYEKYQGQLMKFKDEEIQINSDCIQLDAQLKEALEHVKDDIANLCEEKDSLQYKLTKIQEVVDGKKSQYEVAKSELEVYVLPESTEKEKLKLLIQNLEKMTERLLKTKEEKQQMLERLPVVEKDLMLAKDEKKQLAHEEEICSKQLHVIQMKLHEAHQTMTKSVSSNKVVEYLTNCKLENKLPGFFGRLGDLGAIDEMYDVPVSTACGFLNHMVVDTVKTAQESIELLRQSNIGQASFIVLEYQQKPENAPRLIDLIKLADERVRVAFYFALRNTLVANDVAQATRVAFSGGNRNRVVTLQGHIIEATGEMTGGGHTVKKGLMSQKVPEAPVTQQTVEDLGKKIQECQKKLEEFTRKIHEIDKKMCFLTPEINNMKTKTQKLETEIMTLQREHPKLEHEVKNQEKRVLEVTVDPAKVAALTLVMGKAKKVFWISQSLTY